MSSRVGIVRGKLSPETIRVAGFGGSLAMLRSKDKDAVDIEIETSN